MALTHREVLEVLARHRGNRIVITTMTAVGIWPELSDTPLDFAYLPSAMGHAPGLALGLAMAQPEHGAVVVNGDGSMLMNLGALVTLANHPANVYVLILDNAMYEVTGGQPTAAGGHTDFAALARGAGIVRVYEFHTGEQWQAGAAQALSGPGPVVIWLHVEGRLGQKTPKAPRPMAEQIARLHGALQIPGK
jgi:thiamine pyrophosphate-dependent acetolactate synthase large subunit-like protein